MCVKDNNGVLIVQNVNETLKYYKSQGIGDKRLSDARLFQPFDTIPGLLQYLSFYNSEFYNSEENAKFMEKMLQEPPFALSLCDESAPQDMHWHNYSWEIFAFIEVVGQVKVSWQNHFLDAKGNLSTDSWSTYTIEHPGQLLVVKPGYCHFMDFTQASVTMIVIQAPPARTNQGCDLSTKNPVKIAGDACPHSQCSFREECISLRRDALSRKPLSPVFG